MYGSAGFNGSRPQPQQWSKTGQQAWGNARNGAGHFSSGVGGGAGPPQQQRMQLGPIAATSAMSAAAGGNGYANGGGHRPQPPQQQQAQLLQAGGFEVGPGLNNLGNTCYLNSVLQVLVHAPLLYEAMRQSPHAQECGRRERSVYCLLCRLEAFIQQIRQQRAKPPPQHQHSFSFASSSSAVSPRFLTDHLRFLSPSLMLGRQEDAAELLRLLRDKLQFCWVGKDDPEFKALPVQDKPYPFSLFGGTLQSVVKCLGCQTQSFATDPMEDLVLEITVNGGRPLGSMVEALEHFTAMESLDGANRYRCEAECKSLQSAKRRFLLGRIPPLLCIQLKRFSFFSHFGSKLSHPVSFPPRLDFTPFCSKKALRTQGLSKVEGELFGVIVHQGSSLNSGHYYALVKSPGNGRWFECNDSWVQATTARDVLEETRGAYMLFYRMHGTPMPPAPLPKKPRLNGIGTSDDSTTQEEDESEGDGSGSGSGHGGVNGHGHGNGGMVVIGPQLPPGMVRPPLAEEEEEGKDDGDGGGSRMNGGRKRPHPESPPPTPPRPPITPSSQLSLSSLEDRIYALLRSDAVAWARRQRALAAVEERLAAMGRAGQPPPPSEGQQQEEQELYAVADDALLSGAPDEGRGILSDAERLEAALLNAGTNGHEAAPPPAAGAGKGTGK